MVLLGCKKIRKGRTQKIPSVCVLRFGRGSPFPDFFAVLFFLLLGNFPEFSRKPCEIPQRVKDRPRLRPVKAPRQSPRGTPEVPDGSPRGSPTGHLGGPRRVTSGVPTRQPVDPHGASRGSLRGTWELPARHAGGPREAPKKSPRAPFGIKIMAKVLHLLPLFWFDLADSEGGAGVRKNAQNSNTFGHLKGGQYRAPIVIMAQNNKGTDCSRSAAQVAKMSKRKEAGRAFSNFWPGRTP